MIKKCIIVDDEQTARNIIRSYVNEVPFLELISEFKNAIEALEYLRAHKIDVIFLDIEMPKLSGINFAKIIGKETQIIFTTAHRDFAVEGFELNAADYLLKPFSFDRFLSAIQKLKMPLGEQIESKSPDYIFVKVNKQMVKVEFDSLL